MNKCSGLIFALLVALLFCGCGKEEVASPVAKRMNDPAYVKQLDTQNQERKSIMSEVAAFQKEYEAAKAEDPEGKGEKMKALEKKRQELSIKIEKNRLKTMAIIRDRMNKDSNAKSTKK